MWQLGSVVRLPEALLGNLEGETGQRAKLEATTQNIPKPLVELIWSHEENTMRVVANGKKVKVWGGQTIKVDITEYGSVKKASEALQSPTLSDGFTSKKIMENVYWVQYYGIDCYLI